MAATMSESELAALAALPGMSSRRLAHLLDGRTVAEAWVLVLAFVWAVAALLVLAVASALGLKRKQRRLLLALLPQS